VAVVAARAVVGGDEARLGSAAGAVVRLSTARAELSGGRVAIEPAELLAALPAPAATAA